MTDKTTHISIKEFLKIAGDNFEQGRYQASLELYAAILKAKPDILIANLRMAEKMNLLEITKRQPILRKYY